MANDRPDKIFEKQKPEEQEMRFDALELMKEGLPKGDQTKEPTEGEHAAMLRNPALYTEHQAKSEANLQNAMQALDRGDEGPAQRLIAANEKEIAQTRKVIASITQRAEEQQSLAWKVQNG